MKRGTSDVSTVSLAGIRRRGGPKNGVLVHLAPTSSARPRLFIQSQKRSSPKFAERVPKIGTTGDTPPAPHWYAPSYTRAHYQEGSLVSTDGAQRRLLAGVFESE